jgi:hypothetical protein
VILDPDAPNKAELALFYLSEIPTNRGPGFTRLLCPKTKMIAEFKVERKNDKLKSDCGSGSVIHVVSTFDLCDIQETRLYNCSSRRTTEVFW